MEKSVKAYDNESRVTRYDADMDLLHPKRHKMVDVALEVLPFPTSQSIHVLDLGVGTGYFASRLLRQFRGATLVGLDGSAAMIDLAGARLSEFTEQDRVRFVRSCFQDLSTGLAAENPFDLVFSSYSLHHLAIAEKRRVIGEVVARLVPGGWFLNADLVSHPFPEIERVIQDARVAGIHRRNRGRDPRFATRDAIRAFIGNLEVTEGDQPLPIDVDLAILRDNGIANATVLWKEYREAVYGGTRC